VGKDGKSGINKSSLQEGLKMMKMMMMMTMMMRSMMMMMMMMMVMMVMMVIMVMMMMMMMRMRVMVMMRMRMLCSTYLRYQLNKEISAEISIIFAAENHRSEARSLEELLPVKTLPGPGDPQVITGWMM